MLIAPSLFVRWIRFSCGLWWWTLVSVKVHVVKLPLNHLTHWRNLFSLTPLRSKEMSRWARNTEWNIPPYIICEEEQYQHSYSYCTKCSVNASCRFWWLRDFIVKHHTCRKSWDMQCCCRASPHSEPSVGTAQLLYLCVCGSSTLKYVLIIYTLLCLKAYSKEVSFKFNKNDWWDL